VNTRQKTTGRRSLIMIGLVCIAAFAIGCGGAESGSDSSTLGLLSSAANDGGQRPAPPTYAEIVNNVQLRSDQLQPMEDAVETWHAAVTSQWETRQAQRESGTRRERGAIKDRAAPMQDFLVESAGILDSDQLVQLIAFLAENREENRQAMAQNRSGKGKRFEGHRPKDGQGRGQKHDRLPDELNLTEEQRAQLAEARQPMRDVMQELHAQYPGGRKNEEFQTKAQELRDKMRATMEGILTQEQLDQLQQLRDNRHAERSEQREEMVETKLDRHVEFLTGVLDLTDTQSEQVRDILASSHEQTKTLMENAREDKTARDELRDAMKNIKDEAATTIRGILTPEQTAIFDALKEMMPRDGRPGRRGHPRGHGMRRG